MSHCVDGIVQMSKREKQDVDLKSRRAENQTSEGSSLFWAATKPGSSHNVCLSADSADKCCLVTKRTLIDSCSTLTICSSFTFLTDEIRQLLTPDWMSDGATCSPDYWAVFKIEASLPEATVTGWLSRMQHAGTTCTADFTKAQHCTGTSCLRPTCTCAAAVERPWQLTVHCLSGLLCERVRTKTVDFVAQILIRPNQLLLLSRLADTNSKLDTIWSHRPAATSQWSRAVSHHFQQLHSLKVFVVLKNAKTKQ